MTTTDPEYHGVCIGEGCPVPHDAPDVSRETSEPTPILSGRFAIYETPAGGYHLAYRTEEGPDEDQHFDVPAHLVKVFNHIGGNPRGIMGRLLGKFGG